VVRRAVVPVLGFAVADLWPPRDCGPLAVPLGARRAGGRAVSRARGRSNE